MPRLEPSAAHKKRRCARGGRNAQRWATMRSVAESRDSLKGRPTGNKSCSCRAMDRQAQTAARDTQNAWGSGVPPAAGMQNGGAGGRGSWTPVTAAPRAGQQRSAWLEGRNNETSREWLASDSDEVNLGNTHFGDAHARTAAGKRQGGRDPRRTQWPTGNFDGCNTARAYVVLGRCALTPQSPAASPTSGA